MKNSLSMDFRISNERMSASAAGKSPERCAGHAKENLQVLYDNRSINNLDVCCRNDSFAFLWSNQLSSHYRVIVN
jgi:hypothetical protein